jgi:hypothetical protein
MRVLTIALVTLAAVLAGCVGAHAVTDAQVTDWVSNTEAMNNGFYIVWVRYDITSAYCTRDQALFNRARELADGVTPVVIKYVGLNIGDEGANGGIFDFNGWDECDRNVDEGVTTYRLVSIEPAERAQTDGAAPTATP